MKFLRTDNIIRLTKGGVKYKVWQHQVTSALLMALYQVSSEAVSGVISAFPNQNQQVGQCQSILSNINKSVLISLGWW